MGSALDDYDEEPAAPAKPVLGAPEPGGKADYTRVPGAAPSASSSLDEFDEPYAVPPEVSHPLFGQAPGDWTPGEAPTYWRHTLKELPIVGDPIDRGINALAASGRASDLGITVPQAEAEIEAAQEMGDRAHPGYATGGDITGGVGGLAVLAATAPEVFGTNARTKTGGAVLGAGSNVAVKALDNWIRLGPDEVTKDLGITAIGGAVGGAVSAAINRGFSAAIKPGLEELAHKANAQGIKLPAGLVSANPLLAKLPSHLLSGKSGARALDAWHKAIVRTVGSDAPRLTARVLSDASKRIADRVQALSKLPPGTKWAAEEMDELAEQAKNVRILEGVTAIDRYGRFSPQAFHEAVQAGMDAAAKTPTFAKADTVLADLASIGTTFLKDAPDAKMDWTAAYHMVLKQGAGLLAPAAGHHLLTHGLSMPDLTTAGIITGAVAGAKMLGRGIASLGGEVAARSPRLGNALIRQSTSPMVISGAAKEVAKQTAPGLVQQAVPVADEAFQ